MPPPRFLIEDEAREGRFRWGPEREALHARFYDGLEAVAPEAVRAAYLAILEEDPYFIDAHNALGARALDEDDLDAALNHYARARELGERVVPKGFRGRVIWGYLDNRPFLRALHGSAECLLRLRQREPAREAVRLLRRILRYNPTDNTGARYLLGEACLRAGDPAAAERALKKALDHPHSRYLYGLVLAEQDRLVEAATHLRLAFTHNFYVAELLVGKRPLLPYEIGVYNRGQDGLGGAEEHVAACGDLWLTHSQAYALLRSLFRNGAVMEEVEAVYALRVLHARVKGVTPEAIQQRGRLSAEADAVTNGIDEASSQAILRGIKRYAKEV